MDGVVLTHTGHATTDNRNIRPNPELSIEPRTEYGPGQTAGCVQTSVNRHMEPSSSNLAQTELTISDSRFNHSIQGQDKT